LKNATTRAEHDDGRIRSSCARHRRTGDAEGYAICSRGASLRDNGLVKRAASWPRDGKELHYKTTLFAVPFDAEHLAAGGVPAPILEDVSSTSTAEILRSRKTELSFTSPGREHREGGRFPGWIAPGKRSRCTRLPAFTAHHAFRRMASVWRFPRVTKSG